MTGSSRAGGATAPFIVRIAGLPADVVRGTDLGRSVERARRIEERLSDARQALTERLYEAIHGAPQERRRFLLKVKRDCYNGRSLDRHRRSDGWTHVQAADAESAERILQLEAELTRWRENVAAAYDDAACDEANRLARLLDDQSFLCGLAIASPVVARQSRRLVKRPPEAYRRRERKLVPTLLRYVTRAALKLSPFSTFTPVGLGSLSSPEPGGGTPGPDVVQLAPGPWRDSSLLRFRRYLLDQYWELLHRNRSLREHLRVGLNDSQVRHAAEGVTFLRPAHWRPDNGELAYFEESLVRARLSESLLAYLESRLGGPGTGPRPPWRELVDDLTAHFGTGREEVAEQVDRLIDIGFLHPLPPWSTDEPHLEKAMLQALRRLPVAPRIEPFLDPLQRLVALQDGLLTGTSPARDLAEIEELAEVLWQAAARLAGLELQERADEQRYELYQDVFRRPDGADSGENWSLATVPREAAEAAVHTVEPLTRYSSLFDHRRDFLSTLGAVLRSRSPGRSAFSLFVAFEAVQELWQDYVRFFVSARGSSRWGSTWNPLELSGLAELERFRHWARAEIHDCMADGAQGRQIDGGALAAVLDRAPAGAASTLGGSCLFLQPAAADGSLWVLNRLKEGTGRFGSRYTPSMTDAERRHYTEWITERASFEVDGEPVEFLDVQCIQGDTLNVHAPQTPKVLTLPGATSDLPAERRRTLADLVITLGDDGLPQLRDVHGQRYLPVHLGVGYHDYMPTVVKFLCLFGPSELGAVFPPPWSHRRGEMRVSERTLIGNVVIHRKGWSAPTAQLRTALEGLSDVEAFERLNRWRLERAIPERVFLREVVPHPYSGRRYRPQFIDFSSPGLVTILRSAVQSDEATVTLVEMLPDPEAFPRDADGRAWAVELLLDSIALGPPRRATTTPIEPPQRVTFSPRVAEEHPRSSRTRLGDREPDPRRDPKARRRCHG